MISFKLIKGSFFDLAREKGGGRGMSRIHIIVRGGERVLEVWLERKEKKKELQRKINRAVKKKKPSDMHVVHLGRPVTMKGVNFNEIVPDN